jgi:hypothetical protein
VVSVISSTKPLTNIPSTASSALNTFKLQRFLWSTPMARSPSLQPIYFLILSLRLRTSTLTTTPLASASSPVVATMPNTRHGDPGSLHPEDESS